MKNKIPCRTLIKEVYRNYYLDFVMFNYTIDEFLLTAQDDYGDVSEHDRKWARIQLHERFLPWAQNFKEFSCQEGS